MSTFACGADVIFGSGCDVASGVVIGDGCNIGPNVVLEVGTVLGDGVEIQAGAVIGTYGFGYTRAAIGEPWIRKPHTYGVHIGNDVVIGANACIDRGSWRHTTIDDGCRIDNLVHIAHNVQLSKRVVVVALAELSGSVEVEEDAFIGVRACVRQRLRIGARALVGMGAVVVDHVPADVTVLGCPARIVKNVGVGVGM